jgi:hypothetical protein
MPNKSKQHLDGKKPLIPVFQQIEKKQEIKNMEGET